MPSENELYSFARRSVFSIKKIKKGDVFAPENIAVLRNGKNEPGLHPREFEKIIGKKSLNDLEPFTGVSSKDVG